jgi:hypothetical protein
MWGARTAAQIKIYTPNMQGHQKQFRGPVRIHPPPQQQHCHIIIAHGMSYYGDSCYLLLPFRTVQNDRKQRRERRTQDGRKCRQHDKSLLNLILLRKPETYTTDLGPGPGKMYRLPPPSHSTRTRWQCHFGHTKF